jgi:hypothetical protein
MGHNRTHALHNQTVVETFAFSLIETLPGREPRREYLIDCHFERWAKAVRK